MNQVALDFIKAREKCRLLAYQDSGCKWTVGWGATGPAIGYGTQWTQAEAEADLIARVGKVETAVSMAVAPLRLTLQQEAALISFAYNVGTFAALGPDSHVRAFVKVRNWLAAMKALLTWDHVAGVEMQGLFKRRCEEAALFLEGTV
ncbi:MAG TPA: lysozyme [Rhizomicrobium sp.]|jgi:lysozyme|nr:lysozyme [Rhizomicrobium sp.]